ncbi:MAG: fimbria/pilus outer membrane usher protein [Pasteurellaceae bacterium]|nr:fimbria/pilus outer membrane usher protein [Pasteurellaceae bacterium]
MKYVWLTKTGYVCAMLCCATSVSYAEEVEFDERFLGMSAGQPVADLSKYRLGNPIPTGRYQVDVSVNGVRQGRVEMMVEERNDDPIQGICLTPRLATVLSLKSEAFALPPKEKCVNIVQAIPEAKIQFEMGELSLNVEIPQILVLRRPRGYVPPSLWQPGSPVAFVRYYASQQMSRSQNGKQMSYRYLSLRGGVNIGGWALRHQGAKSWVNQHALPYQYQHTYLSRDVDSVRGRLTLGDFATHGQFFASMNLRGVQLASDERMLPASLRGYAPVIEGIARSYARVIVRQQDRVIYETNVPAGAFRIDDLYPSGYSGDLLVEIIEADGQVHSFTVPFAKGLRLLRKGQFRYNLAGGRLRQGAKILPESLFQGEMQYGLINGLTLNLGVNTSRNYFTSVLGLAVDTPIGAFATDLQYAYYRFPHIQQKQKKYAMTVGYNARIPQLNTVIAASYYRSFQPEHYSLSQVLEINRFGKILPQLTPLQQRLTVSLQQPLGKNWGSLGVSGVRESYRHAPTSRYYYQLHYGNSYKGLHYQVGYAQHSAAYSTGKKDRRFSFNLSWLFGHGTNKPMLYSHYQKAPNAYHLQTTLSGTLGQEGRFHYSLSTSQQPNQRDYSVYGGYKTSVASINVGFSRAKQSQQGQVNLSGGIVAHAKGITLSNDLGDTFAIIHAKGATGAKINNSNGAYLDWFGNGIVPFIAPYQTNYVGIDPTPVADNVEVEATGREIIPRANSAVLVTLKTKSGAMALFDVSLANGDVPPLAADVFDQQHNHVGYVVQGGRVFVRGVEQRGTLKVIWGSGEREQCQFHYQLGHDPHQAIAVQCQ